jgi:hypothetical protein
VRHDYDPDKASCGADQHQKCAFSTQLMPSSALEGLGIGEPASNDVAYGAWQYNGPEQRLSDWISPNTGDIILLSNARFKFQFGSPYSGQHGGLTFADSIVPVAFGFPGASGNSSEDTLLAPLQEFMSGFDGDAVPALLGQKIVRAMLEADALRAFFHVSGSQ